jgi:uncharacterized protein (DUF2062 family)
VPWRAAASVAVGLAIGVTPLWGVHWLLVLGVCLLLDLDAVVAFVASNVSLPFIAPFITLAEIEIGAWVLTGHGLPLDVATLRSWGIGPFLRELVVGVALMAAGAALVGGGVAYGVAWLARARRSGNA